MTRTLTPIQRAVSLRTLGQLELPERPFSRPKPLLLLAYLALEGPKDKRFLAELFFPDSEDRAGSLRQTLARLRRAGDGLIEGDAQHLWTPLWSDAAAFLAALEARDLAAAVALYGGPFLAGLSLPELGVELEEWVYGTREFLAGALRGALLTLAEEAARLGEGGAATRYAERAYRTPGAPELEPESFGPLYALLAAGRSPHAAALRAEADEVGVALAPFEMALIGAAWTGERPPQPSFTPLPAPKGAFVGRAEEQRELGSLLARPEVRLLTLLGPGGVGKTRLALELAAAQQGRFSGGVVFVPLETLTDPAQLPATLAAALHLTLQPEGDALSQIVRALGDAERLLVFDTFEHLLAGSELLNHLLAACPNLKLLVTSRERLNLGEEWVFPLEGLGFPPPGAPLSAALGYGAVQLFVQRAKRARLSFTLTPQDLPFVLQLCNWVQGSPLGLELAAGWVKLLSCEEIAGEFARNLDLETSVRDAPPRQRSLKAVFESSWGRLSEAEQAVLKKLSVFRGGFTRGAAAEVAGATLPVLVSLVDKSLLRVSERGRYDRHLLVYRYTQEKLAQDPREETATRQKHAAYFVALVEEAEPHLTSAQQQVWLDRLEVELNNLRAALEWLAAQPEGINRLFGFVSALSNFWLGHSHISEGRRWQDTALAHRVAAEPLLRAQVLLASGAFSWLQGDFQIARSRLEESLSLQKDLQDKPGMAATLGNLASLAVQEGRYDVASDNYQESMSLFQELNDREGIANCLHNLGVLASRQGDFLTARRWYERSLPLFRGLGSQRYVATTLNSLARVAWAQGELTQASKLAEEALGIHRSFNDQVGAGTSLHLLALVADAEGAPDLAWVRHREGLLLRQQSGDKPGMISSLEGLASLLRATNPARAVSLWSAAATARAQLGFVRPQRDVSRYKYELSGAREALEERAFAAAWAEGQRLGLEAAVAWALESGADDAAREALR